MSKLNGKKLIVVEDEDINIFLLKAMLDNSNANVIYCKNADEFLDVYDEKKDIILLDIKLDGVKDGIDILKEIKEKDPNQKVIMQTAYVDKKNKCLDLGADDFIEKPLTRDILMGTLEKHINLN